MTFNLSRILLTLPAIAPIIANQPGAVLALNQVRQLMHQDQRSRWPRARRETAHVVWPFLHLVEAPSVEGAFGVHDYPIKESIRHPARGVEDEPETASHSKRDQFRHVAALDTGDELVEHRRSNSGTTWCVGWMCPLFDWTGPRRLRTNALA